MTGTTTPTAAASTNVRAFLEERLATGKLDLPMLPDVAMDTLRLCQSETADAAQLSAILHKDQSMASHLLRIANSPLYAAATPIVSLQQAVGRLGLRMLSEIVVSIATGARVFKVAGHEKTMRGLWRHSVIAGAFAKEVARSRRRNVEGAFLCGLLHDVGKPVLLQAIADWQKQQAVQLAEPEVQAILDELHTTFGFELATRWKLPEQVGIAILNHHDYSKAVAHAESAMLACLADMLSYHAMNAAGALDDAGIRALPVLEHLNLYPDDVDGLLQKKDQILALAEAFGS